MEVERGCQIDIRNKHIRKHYDTSLGKLNVPPKDISFVSYEIWKSAKISELRSQNSILTEGRSVTKCPKPMDSGEEETKAAS